MRNVTAIIFLTFFLASCQSDVMKGGLAELISSSLKTLNQQFSIPDDYLVGAMLSNKAAVVASYQKMSVNSKSFKTSAIKSACTTKKEFTNSGIYTENSQNGIHAGSKLTRNENPKIQSFEMIELKNTSFAIEDLSFPEEINGTSLENLTAVFSISENSKLYSGFVEQISGETKNDQTQTLHNFRTGDEASEKKYTHTTEADNKTPQTEARENMLILGAETSGVDETNFLPVDSAASQETIVLYKNIAKIANSEQFIFGQEHPLSFQLHEIRYDLSTSDCKDVTGDHPGVYGIDPHYMLYSSDQEKEAHLNEAKHAYQNGAIVTFDFHQQSKADHQIYFARIASDSDKRLMHDIVNDKNDTRSWFYGELDEIIDIINNDLDFPVVFRLFHEMNGNWFWWGTSAVNHSPELYINFYKLAVDYVKARTNLVLFAWSSNTEIDVDYYPGDSYVDIIGFDVYEPNKIELTSKLIELSEFAYERNKVAILAETGNRNDYISNAPDFWTSSILGAITEGGNEIKIAWVLAWFNAPWANLQRDLFIPNSESPVDAKNDFINFKNDSHTLFQEDLKALEIYK